MKPITEIRKQTIVVGPGWLTYFAYTQKYHCIKNAQSRWSFFKHPCCIKQKSHFGKYLGFTLFTKTYTLFQTLVGLTKNGHNVNHKLQTRVW